MAYFDSKATLEHENSGKSPQLPSISNQTIVHGILVAFADLCNALSFEGMIGTKKIASSSKAYLIREEILLPLLLSLMVKRNEALPGLTAAPSGPRLAYRLAVLRSVVVLVKFHHWKILPGCNMRRYSSSARLALK